MKTLGWMGLLGGLLASSLMATGATLPDLSSSIRGATLDVTPPAAHHFNTEAPAKASQDGTALKLKLEKNKVAIHLTPGSPGKTVDLQVFICDDAKTFCLKKKQSFAVPSGTKITEAAASATAKKATVSASAHSSIRRYTDTETGFIVNDPDRAFKLAADRKLPLLIDFFGIWCPPCNHLDAMVFRSKEFKKKNAKRFVHLKLDADHDAFNALKSRYKIQFLPTVIFATSDGDEISRLLGYHPLDEMLAKTQTAYENRAEGYAQLLAKAQGMNAEAQFKAAQVALDRDEPEQALLLLQPMEDLFRKSKDARLEQVYQAKLGVAKLKSDTTEQRRVLRRWTEEFPQSVHSISGLEALATLEAESGNTAASQAALRAAVNLVSAMIAQPSLARGSEYSPSDLKQTLAGLYEELNEADAARGAYLACAESYAKDAKAEGGGFARGPNLERAYCLGKAGKVAESEKIYREGVRRYPNEYTFHAGLAKLLLERKNAPKEALKEIDLALKHAYGNQRLKATLTKVKALEALGEWQNGVRVIDAELELPLPENALASTLRVREQLKTKREQLTKKTTQQ